MITTTLGVFACARDKPAAKGSTSTRPTSRAQGEQRCGKRADEAGNERDSIRAGMRAAPLGLDGSVIVWRRWKVRSGKAGGSVSEQEAFQCNALVGLAGLSAWGLRGRV